MVLSAFFSRGRVGRPSISMMPVYRLTFCDAEGVAHRTGHDLELRLVLARGRHQHHEERHQQAHQVGEGHEPAVTATVGCFLFLRHAAIRCLELCRSRLGCVVIVHFGMAMLLRQIGQQHLADQRRALGLADHQHAVDDQRPVDFLVMQLQLQLVGDRQTEQVGERRHRRTWRAAPPP